MGGVGITRKTVVLLKIEGAPLTWLCHLLNVDPGFHGIKPQKTRLMQASQSDGPAESSNTAGFANAQLREMLTTLPALKSAKQWSLILWSQQKIVLREKAS